MTVIPIVQGNLLRLGIPLQVVKITSVEGVVDKQVEDFVPNPNFPVKVLLSRGSTVYEFTATIEGNKAIVEDKGTVHVGKYAVTVLCRDAEDNPMRFKQKDAVHFVDTTAEAGIAPGVEFETGTQWLDGAVFLALTTQGGGGIGEESDPIFSASPAAGITTEDINKWDGKQDALTFDNAPTDNSTKPVKSGGIKAYVDGLIQGLQNVLNTITQDGATQGVIDTFNEVKAFLEGIDTSDPTLFNQLKGLDDAITALQRAYAGLATVATSGSYNDLSNKPDLSDYVTTLSLEDTLAGYASKNGSGTEDFYTSELIIQNGSDSVNFYMELDENDDPVLHITSSNGGDLSIPFGANEVFAQIATTKDLVSMPIVDASAMANEATGGRMAEALANASKSVTIDAGKYYDFGVRPLTGESGLSIFPKAQTDDMDNAYSYVGRFTVDENLSGDFQFALISVRKGLTGNVLEGDGDFSFKLPDEVEFEAGHTYEFNILFDTAFIKDITVEEGA